ncbi:hypothetical protein PBV87_14490 [Niameybacter massiliensis]|uniref:Uncharacterized protein n=1 Tax=Holtiella tumoricola TaxID=3018743 RepID=A0AA42DPC1_9FIRM|nr:MULTISPECIES: hypothetical protein [Lachnospirales]MDA3732698.1 hypothetical protein [Holtiella tumoricola]
MNVTAANGNMIETRLRLLGATKIEKVSGVLYFVKFELDNHLEVSYAYNVNAKDKYFLQRIKPYPIPEGLFSDEEQVVEFIRRDIEKFKNAQRSTNFMNFVELVRIMNGVSRDMESLFLNYNVDKVDLERLISEFTEVQKTIKESKEHSTHVVLTNVEIQE